MLICIDAGHGGADPGAVNGALALYEKDAALAIAQKLGAALVYAGAQAIYTRADDRDVELAERAAYANAAGADYFISIHLNGAAAKSAQGIETYAYSAASPEARKLAKAVQEELVAATGAADRGVKTAHFYVLRATAMPAILVETGFITNDAEARRLFDARYQDAVAAALARGVLA